MMVTELLEASSSRVKVYIEQEFAFVLYKGELRKYGLKAGQEIKPEVYAEILQEVLPKRAKLRCMNLLQSKDYTREQLKQKLKQGFYPEEVMEEALDYVASFHYIDDLRFAQDYIYYNESRKSRRRIDMDLLKKGVASDTITKAWLLWEDAGNEQDEDAQIAMLLEKKHFDAETADMKELQRMYGFLARRGFDGEKIRKALLK